MNIAESALNILYLLLSAQESPVAVLVGFTATVMTASKTVLYWLVDQVRLAHFPNLHSVFPLTDRIPPYCSNLDGAARRSPSNSLRLSDTLTLPVNSGHNTPRDWVVLYAIPNGAWIVFPCVRPPSHTDRLLTDSSMCCRTLLAVMFYQQIARSLRVAAKTKTL